LTQNDLPSKITKREISGETTPKTGMPQEPNAPSAIEQVVARALRDNLERIQHTSDELHHAVNDVVSACASNKPANALPPMLRAQTAAASLAAALEVLSRFIAVSLQPGPRSPLEAQITNLVSKAIAEPPSAPPQRPKPAAPPVPKAAPVHVEPVIEEPVETELELHPEPEPLELVEPTAPPVEVESEL
jgi:hypothetical protein